MSGGDRVEALAQAAERGERGRRERGQRPRLIDVRDPAAGSAPHPRPRPRSGARPSGSRCAAAGGARSRRRARSAVGMELRVRGPLTGPEQLGHGRVRAALDQLADGVAAVQQATVLAVDEPDRALGGDDTLEARGIRPLVDGRARDRGRGGLIRHAAMVVRRPRRRPRWRGADGHRLRPAMAADRAIELDQQPYDGRARGGDHHRAQEAARISCASSSSEETPDEAAHPTRTFDRTASCAHGRGRRRHDSAPAMRSHDDPGHDIHLQRGRASPPIFGRASRRRACPCATGDVTARHVGDGARNRTGATSFP